LGFIPGVLAKSNVDDTGVDVVDVVGFFFLLALNISVSDPKELP
jgi:hypothetical protein